VHNNQRDDFHCHTINRGHVAYEPNLLAGGCPFQAGAKGFVSFAQPVQEDKARGKPEKFADHYTQATLFFESQTPVEQPHIVGGFRFDLSKLTMPAIRERMLASLVNVSPDLAAQVAAGLGIDVPPALPKALEVQVEPEVTRSRSRQGCRCWRGPATAVFVLARSQSSSPMVLRRGPSRRSNKRCSTQVLCPRW
jgi:catalase